MVLNRPTVDIKKKLVFGLILLTALLIMLVVRIGYIQVNMGDTLIERAYEQQTRDRLISPKRGSILDRNGAELASAETVWSVSVIHVRIDDEEKTARFLADTLELDYDEVLEKVSRKVALNRIKTKVEREAAMEIIEADLPGVVVDEDVKRIYPYNNLAAQVIGFVGRDNQGIIGLEAKYDSFLKGKEGKILSQTDVKGYDVGKPDVRQPPTDGYDLLPSIDCTLQQYSGQVIKCAVEAKSAKRGLIVIMNPQNGEIYAMANFPDFNLNEPFKINDDELLEIWADLSSEERNEYLNRMWRNTAINDTYEPGSTFKIITSVAGLEEGVVTEDSPFFCKGYHTVGDRMIKCWRYPRTHGAQTFKKGVQNSCNPVFMMIAERLGAEKYYEYLYKFGFNKKTGIDLSGEASGIMYPVDKAGPVELATMSFGQSIAITPMHLLKAAAIAVNGGRNITPHFGIGLQDSDGNRVETFEYDGGQQVISEKTSETMREILESVVAEGTGNKTYIPGYRIGGKTATSEKLPRKRGKYIASFLAFAPADDPQVMALVLIDEPSGTYYGGSVAGPVMKTLMSNVLPYLGIEPWYTEEELELEEVKETEVPDFTGMNINEAKSLAGKNDFSAEKSGEGDTVKDQFPKNGEKIRKHSKIILYT